MGSLSKRIAVVIGHPDPKSGRFNHALAAAYAESAAKAGHEVRCLAALSALGRGAR